MAAALMISGTPGEIYQQHFVRSVVGGAPGMLGALTQQGPGVLDAIVREVAEATRSYVDDEGWASAQASNIITAVA